MTPGLIVAAPRSGAGKTTVTLGLMRALGRRGVAVQPFKCGPDYIDPAFHTAATGRPSYSLDGWAMSAGMIRQLASTNADLAMAEGVMGLFDGVATAGRSSRGATADVAAILGWPVVLVLDVSGQSETAAAIASGLARYRDDVEIAGAILNRVASPRHLASIAPAFERIGMRLFGALGNDAAIALPSRHLGLVQAVETLDLDHRLDRIADLIEGAVDVEAIRGLARPAVGAGEPVAPRPPGQRIALAEDQAFTFMYPHLVDAWRAAGAEIQRFSPLADEAPAADSDAVWLPGGYPELHAGVLAAAGRFRAGLRALAEKSVPIHGECGGYMVLGEGLEDAEGRRHAMAGLLPLETSFAKRRMHLGYRRARLLADGVLGKSGSEVFGHEFHYATVLSAGGEALVDCRDAAGATVAEAGARRGSVTGTFFHLIA
jgi:cobyrinic acid a,c-diamide synthase